MKYLSRRRSSAPADEAPDPLEGIINLFDLVLVFTMGLLLALFSVYRLDGLFDERTDVTVMKKNADGQLEIMQKQGKKIETMRVSREKTKGLGERLGTAYRLEDGSFVYVPE